MKQNVFLRITVVGFVVLTCVAMASAQNAGYDLFQTGSGASIDLTSQGLGVVPLAGKAIESCTGNSDTIMNRTTSVPSGGGTVPVNVTALFMKSTQTVTVSGQAADVYVTINNTGGTIATSVLPQPDSLSASGGSLTVRTDGTFDSSITVNADVIFVKAGTSVTNSGNWLGHQPASAISLSSSGSSWSSSAPSGYPSCSSFPSGGFYVITVAHVNGPHPVVTATTPSGGGCGINPTPESGTVNSGNTKKGKNGSKPASPSGNATVCLN
jgi:hypothetical protein